MMSELSGRYLAGVGSSFLITGTEHGGCDLVVIIIRAIAHCIADDGHVGFLKDVGLSAFKKSSGVKECEIETILKVSRIL